MNKTVAQRLAHQIRAQIDAASLTQTAIGDALHMSQSALSRRYLGRVEWRASELAVLARLLGTTVEQLTELDLAKK